MGLRERLAGVYYGYWVLLCAFILHGLDSGLYFYGFSVFYTPLIMEFGWSNAVTAGAVSLSRLEGGLEGPVVGYLIDRFGARKVMAVGIFLTGLGFISMILVKDVWMLYIIYGGVLSIGYNTGFSHSMVAIINQWFIRKRSRAMSIYSVAAGLGGALIVPLLAWSISVQGWRMTAIYCGLTFWVVGLPIVLLLRNKPEDMGLKPDGDSLPLHGEPQSHSARTGRAEPEFTAREAMRSPTFRWLLLGESFRSFLLGSIVLFEIPHLLKLGFSEADAAAILGLMILSSIPGRVIFGTLGDFLSKRLLLIVAMLMQGLGVLIFAYATELAHVYAFLLFYGLAYGGAIPLLMAYRGELFGRKRFATISGIMTPFRTIGSVAGPIFAGYAYDATGSYRFAFTVFTLLAIMSAASFSMIKSEQI